MQSNVSPARHTSPRAKSTNYAWRYLNAMSPEELLRVSESNLQEAIVAYLQEEHPNVLFKCDTSAVKLPISVAAKMKRLGNTRDWPDLFIAHPAHESYGLFIEIKKDGEKIFNTKNEYATPHLRAQAEMNERLRRAGYSAGFAVGWKELFDYVQWYLS